MDAKYLLIVKVPSGLKVLDTPRPVSAGARVLRAEPVGKNLYALGIHNIAGVEYARLKGQNSLVNEWVRVAEADHSIEYVDVIDLEPKSDMNTLADSITLLATAVRELARK